MPYEGLRFVRARNTPHLGGNVIEGDPNTFAPKVWEYLINRFAVQSALDLGSGMGYSAEFLFRNGVRVVAVDGMAENVRSSVYPTIEMDLTKSSVNCSVDLVHCQEVVEHIAPEYLENLLASLTCGKYIVITHALPGQVGHHHVNCQPQEYWVENMARYDCHLLIEDTRRVRDLAELDGAEYLAHSGMVFANRSRI